MGKKTAPMRTQTYLVRRGATYYFRIRIPQDLIKHYDDKDELKVSLRTNDRFEAAQRAREKAIQLHDEFDERRVALARASGKEPFRRVTYVDDAWAQRFCTRALRVMLGTDDGDRRRGLSPEELVERTLAVDEMVEKMREAQARGDIEMVKQGLGPTLYYFRLELDCDRDSYQRLAHAYLSTVMRYATILQCRNAGDVVETDVVAPEEQALSLNPKRADADTIESLFQDWKNAVKDRPLKTVNAYTSVVNGFTFFLKGTTASQLKRGDLLRFRDHLLNDRELAVKTVEKHLGFLCSILQLAVDNERLSSNPALRLKVPRGKVVAKSRIPYSITDLHQILNCKLYRAGVRPNACGGEAAVWLPLLGMYTGARLEELGQLTVGDVQAHPELGWYVEITDLDEQQHVKTESSRRRVPLHRALIDAGFLRYRDSMLALGNMRLFPRLTPDKHGILTAQWSKWWGRYARKHIGITDTRKVFHSFRHLFKEMCREAGLSEEVHDALTGHSRGGVGRSYGGERYPLKPLFEALQKYTLPGLSLPVLVPEPAPLQPTARRKVKSGPRVSSATPSKAMKRRLRPQKTSTKKSSAKRVRSATDT